MFFKFFEKSKDKHFATYVFLLYWLHSIGKTVLFVISGKHFYSINVSIKTIWETVITGFFPPMGITILLFKIFTWNLSYLIVLSRCIIDCLEI